MLETKFRNEVKQIVELKLKRKRKNLDKNSITKKNLNRSILTKTDENNEESNGKSDEQMTTNNSYLSISLNQSIVEDEVFFSSEKFNKAI